MSTGWRDIVDLGEREPQAQEPSSEGEAGTGRGGMFKRLRESLSRSRQALTEEISATLVDHIDEDAWERLEEALILADTGASTTAKIVESLEREVVSGQVKAEGEAVRERLIELLADTASVGEPRIDLRERPAVVLVVGVNGTGKTTTIGKLAWHLRNELGLGVVIAAADTYRAAAVEQLDEWADRAGATFIRGAEGADPGAVAYDAIAAARARDADVVLIDTAGRLHNKASLMEELSKVRRVIGKQIPEAPHETLISIDATTGQNGVRQAQVFTEAVELDGVVLTKLDGTARGGVTLAIADTLGIPVKLIGVGEGIEDLRPFDAEDFASALIRE